MQQGLARAFGSHGSGGVVGKGARGWHHVIHGKPESKFPKWMSNVGTMPEQKSAQSDDTQKDGERLKNGSLKVMRT